MGGKLSNKTKKGQFEEEQKTRKQIEATVLSLQKKLSRTLGKLVTALQKLDNHTTARTVSCDDSRLEDRDVHTASPSVHDKLMTWGDIELEDFSDHPDPSHKVITHSQIETFPLLSCPDPRPRPSDDAPQELHGTCSDTVHVQCNWRPEELTEIVKELPCPTKNVERWCTSVLDLVEMYQPSAKDLESVFRKVFKLKWPHLKGDFDANGPQNDIVTGQLLNPCGLFSRVRKAYPVHTDWKKVHCIKQNHDESLDIYRARMEQCFNRHAGLTHENAAYNDLLKDALIHGLLPSIHDQVKMSCIGWEAMELDIVWSHAKHAERHLTTQDKTRKTKLEAVQLMYYQQQARTQEMDSQQQFPQQNQQWQHQRWKRGRQDQWRLHQRQKQDQERKRWKLCYHCGSMDHIRRNCAQEQSENNPIGGKRQQLCCFPF